MELSNKQYKNLILGSARLSAFGDDSSSVSSDLTGLVEKHIQGAIYYIVPVKKNYFEQSRSVAEAIKRAEQNGQHEVSIDLESFGLSPVEAAQIVNDATYAFNRYRSKPAAVSLKEIGLIGATDDQLTAAHALIKGINFVRDLGNEPSNKAVPLWLADQAKTLEPLGIRVTILDEKQMKSLGMELFLSVSQGSIHPPALVVLTYQGSAKESPFTALVGKGITFDTGGVSLKPSKNMEEMRYDMMGAATVLGVLKTLALKKSKVNVYGVLACAENAIGSKATRPGDIVKAMDGTTVEILNTDAEGRLVLGDALTYVQQELKPQRIIDMATLTGACLVALGTHRTAVMSNNDALAQALLEAGERTHDLAWRLPLDQHYADCMKGIHADLANIQTKEQGCAGTVTAGCFLHHFIKNECPWAHLDIAGTATSGMSATGRPVPLLVDFLEAKKD